MNNIIKDKIGIFDSGIGGSTVLKEIIKLLPNEQYVYYSDSKNNPYGDKSQKEILAICDNIMKVLLDKGCKAIVIACNTASAQASQFLREKYKGIPIIAIEPAYKMAHDYAYNEPTLVMATKGTVESEKFEELIEKYNNNNTYILPCVGLANAIESENEDSIKECLNKELSIYKGKVKNVVLGCTHYPLVKKEIAEVLGDVRFFDGAPSLAKHLKDVLIEKKLLINRNDSNINENNELKLIDACDHYKNSKDNNDSDNYKNSKNNNDSDNYKNSKNNKDSENYKNSKDNKNDSKINIEFIDSSNSKEKEERFRKIIYNIK